MEDNILNQSESAPTSGERDLSVLLIDDDTELCELMQEFFAVRGIRLEAVHDGRRGLRSPFA